jgi:STE20-related kinase adapter protein alpha
MNGSASLVQEGERRKKVFLLAGYAEWVSPELIGQNDMYSEKSDIYSVGILACELFHGQTPFNNYSPVKVRI